MVIIVILPLPDTKWTKILFAESAAVLVLFQLLSNFKKLINEFESYWKDDSDGPRPSILLITWVFFLSSGKELHCFPNISMGFNTLGAFFQLNFITCLVLENRDA